MNNKLISVQPVTLRAVPVNQYGKRHEDVVFTIEVYTTGRTDWFGGEDRLRAVEIEFVVHNKIKRLWVSLDCLTDGDEPFIPHVIGELS